MTAPAQPAQGFIPHIGIQMEGSGDGKSRCTIEIDETHRNPNGFVHGGVPYALADTGMAAAAFPTLGEGGFAVTVEISLRYLAAFKEGTLICDTSILKAGKRLITLESELWCNDVLVGKATGTYSVIQPGK